MFIWNVCSIPVPHEVLQLTKNSLKLKLLHMLLSQKYSRERGNILWIPEDSSKRIVPFIPHIVFRLCPTLRTSYVLFFLKHMQNLYVGFILVVVFALCTWNNGFCDWPVHGEKASEKPHFGVKRLFTQDELWAAGFKDRKCKLCVWVVLLGMSTAF